VNDQSSASYHVYNLCSCVYAFQDLFRAVLTDNEQLREKMAEVEHKLRLYKDNYDLNGAKIQNLEKDLSAFKVRVRSRLHPRFPTLMPAHRKRTTSSFVSSTAMVTYSRRISSH
jgi:hypothetical protein